MKKFLAKIPIYAEGIGIAIGAVVIQALYAYFASTPQDVFTWQGLGYALLIALTSAGYSHIRLHQPAPAPVLPSPANETPTTPVVVTTPAIIQVELGDNDNVSNS